MHIDDIRSPDNDIPRITDMVGKSIGTLIENATKARHLAQTVKDSSSVDEEENVVMYRREDDEELTDHTKQVALHRNFNFPALVKMCVHSSLAMVKDTDDPGRATHRVKVLIRLLHDASKPGNIVTMTDIVNVNNDYTCTFCSEATLSSQNLNILS